MIIISYDTQYQIIQRLIMNIQKFYLVHIAAILLLVNANAEESTKLQRNRCLGNTSREFISEFR